MQPVIGKTPLVRRTGLTGWNGNGSPMVDGVRLLMCMLLVTLALGTSAFGSVVTLAPIRDNTLIEDPSGLLSNGKGQYLFAGRTNQADGFAIRRALLNFPVSGAIPSGAVIDDVALTLNMSRTPEGATIVDVHRMLTDWGEGASDAIGEEGPGIAAQTGDATWLHSYYDTAFWSQAGGDFEATPSGSQVIIGTGMYTWASTAQMVADVQMWLDDPSTNFGWCLVGVESVNKTVKRFDSRENPNPANRPRVQITYHVQVPAASTWGICVLSLVTLTAGTLLVRRNASSVP